MNGGNIQAKLIFLIFSGALSLVLLIIGGFQLIEFSDSTAFCGRLCHEVMYPEYTVYQASPHSRVLCSDCHVGPGTSYLVKSKIAGIPLIWSTIADSYHRPIKAPVVSLRPARETCEQCHRPERFAGDLVRVHTTYLSDEKNTEKVDTRILRVGGGQQLVARDIHWHIAAEVWYLPLDEERQEIAWVGVNRGNDQIQDYILPDKASQVTPERVKQDRRLMDCIDCHNRATHIFRSPDELVDAALAEGLIDKTLPFIKREITSVLYPPNASLETAFALLDNINTFYSRNYAELYVNKGTAIAQAIKEAKNIARLTTFPEMKTTWDTYEDNEGHQKSRGCFRCHGLLEAKGGVQAGKVIDVSCILCHSEIK